jgi:hypothetical protein
MHHEHQHGPEVARQILAKRLHVDAPAEIRGRVLRLERGGDPGEVEARLVNGDVMLQPAHHLPGMIPALLQGIGLHRPPRPGIARKLEPARHYADDRVGDAVDHDRSTNRVRSRLESVAPHAVAEDEDLGCPDPVFVFPKVAA